MWDDAAEEARHHGRAVGRFRIIASRISGRLTPAGSRLNYLLQTVLIHGLLILPSPRRGAFPTLRTDTMEIDRVPGNLITEPGFKDCFRSRHERSLLFRKLGVLLNAMTGGADEMVMVLLWPGLRELVAGPSIPCFYSYQLTQLGKERKCSIYRRESYSRMIRMNIEVDLLGSQTGFCRQEKIDDTLPGDGQTEPMGTDAVHNTVAVVCILHKLLMIMIVIIIMIHYPPHVK